MWKHESTTRMAYSTRVQRRPKSTSTSTTPFAKYMLPVRSHPSTPMTPMLKWMEDCTVSPEEKEVFQSWEHMKLRGRVMTRDVLVLIDSGCTHNFINAKVVKALGLKPMALDPYVVHLPDGSNKLWDRQVKSVPLRIQTYYDLHTFGIMDLAHIDIILGQQWLYCKDPRISFRKHTVELQHNGKRHKLVGEKNLPDTPMVTA